MGVITVDTRSRQPVYEQLIDNIRENVLLGNIAPGEQLPSVRSLAGELCINPNTIQRAYNELERMNFLVSVPGRGSFISDDLSELRDSQKKNIMCELEKLLVDSKNAGVKKEEVETLLNKVWEEEK